MSNQFLEQQSSEIGLFTFYKKQQQDEEIKKKDQNSKKKRKGNRSKKKILSVKSSANKEPSPDNINANSSCDDFLKSIRPKYKKTELPEVTERSAIQLEEEAKQPIKVETPPKQQNKNSQMSPFHYSQFRPLQKQLVLSPPNTASKLSASLLSAQTIRNHYFKKERQSLNNPSASKPTQELIKQRIRTQINNQLHKNHMDYIHSAERELIIGRKVGPERGLKKDSLASTARPPFKEKYLLQSTNAKFNREGAPLAVSRTSKQLHVENKRYFNNLMEHMAVQPEYNQTVYRILRETLKFPQVTKDGKLYIKTEASSPQKRASQLQTRSKSYYRKVQTEAVGLKERQLSTKGANLLNIAVKGRLVGKNIK